MPVPGLPVIKQGSEKTISGFCFETGKTDGAKGADMLKFIDFFAGIGVTVPVIEQIAERMG